MALRSRQAGFSLVELVMVIVIIGIIAAMAIPRMSRGAGAANDAVTSGNLRLVRDAIIRYAAEHNNAFPGPDADKTIAQLCLYSDESGTTALEPSTNKTLGPYLAAIPPCPIGYFPGNNAIAIDTNNSPPMPTQATEAGWVYNPNTGEFVANAVNFAGDFLVDSGSQS